MIQTISSPRIDWLVRQILDDDNIIKLNPVIAGGAMLSVYRAYKLYDTKDKWRQLERIVETDYSKTSPLFNKLDKFGDIDAWFLSDHPVHNWGYGSWLIADDKNKKDLESPLGSEYREVKSSKWANSFRKKRDSLGGSAGFVFQTIKAPISSVKELFDNFDYINCCVAYYDGTLYYDSRIDSSFNSFRLNLNNSDNYKGTSMPKRVYSGLRAFKYSKRYLLDFSEELSELMFKIYMDLGSVDYSEYDDKVTLVNNIYGTTLMSKNDFRDMVKSFEQNFVNFTRMSTFKGEYAIYLIDRPELNGLKSYINKADPYAKSEECLNAMPF